MSFRLTWLAALLLALCSVVPMGAQAAEGVMSDAEVEALRDAAYVPTDRILAYEKILGTREKRIDTLLEKQRHAGREMELHDLMDQFGSITEEFTDNLDEYRAKHRDIRKSLPKLLQAIDRWSAALKAPPDNDAYNIVRKVALDNLKDLREEAESLGPELEAYFKAHPDAAKAEHDRMNPENSHTPRQ